MFTKKEFLSIEPAKGGDLKPGLSVVAPMESEGICEVVSVDAFDDLPYVFDLVRGQRLTISLAATAALDVVLCEEAHYDKWLDAGLQSDHPENSFLDLRNLQQYLLRFVAPHDGIFLVILINPGNAEVDVAVAANMSA